MRIVAHLDYMSDLLFCISLLDMFFQCQTLSPTVSAIILMCHYACTLSPLLLSTAEIYGTC